ncbi:hypothetical protein KI387_008381, partial [Taxus chinensis]
MRKAMAPFFFIQVIILIWYSRAAHLSHPHTNNATDEEALLAFKSGITYDNMHWLTTWTANVSFCKWKGIQCSLRRQRVASLNLTTLGLEGTISPFLGNLSFLRILDLGNNTFHGHIPHHLGRLSRLRKLYLYTNRLEGSIPTTLSDCRSLQVMEMTDNHLTGNIPPQLGFLPDLEFINFPRNNLTGTIPNSLGNISSLLHIDFQENKLHGSIPWELGVLTQLTVLSLDFNHVTGRIPRSLSNCTSLQILSIVYNNLFGEIPSELCSKNTYLVGLYLGGNQLNGTIPVTLSNCTQLQILELSENLLTGIIPSELGKLSMLTWFSIQSNQLVSSNTSSLSILIALANCTLLEKIGLADNHLQGVIPISVGQLSTKLERVYLEENKLQGEIPPQIGNLSKLTILGLQKNLFTGVIPSTISKLQRLEQLDMKGNNLRGNIPKDIGTLKSLGLLNLAKNKISGNIPHSISLLQQIRYLYLYQNQLTGNIPSGIGKCLNLLGLDLSYNRLSGHIPPQIAGLSNLALSFDLSNNLLQGTLPAGISKMDQVRAIDISANQLTGHIPYVLGSCIALEYLNLSSNVLNGDIPDSLGELQNLQNLDLSFNNLSGKIPKSLGKIKVLQHLNFSMNQLSGEVPKEGIFKDLGLALLNGNLGLCGPWVKLPECSTTQNKSHRHLKRVVIPIVGMATLVIWCLLIGFLWRRYCKKHPKISYAFKLGHQKISHPELVAATNGFDEANLLGVGSFGKVYKGVLQNDRQVAIKVLILQNEDAHKSFERECKVLRRVRHRNLIRIITSYSDPEFKALIFPLMPNGNLDKFLHPESPQSSLGPSCSLDLIQRLNIAMDIAQGMEYLHHYCFVKIIHCDLKPSNVLLGEDMTAYLTDFGISRLFFRNSMDSGTSTHALKGSIGYIAP